MTNSDRASSSTFAFTISVAVMLVATGVTFIAVGDVANRGVIEEANQVALRQEAENLADILLGTAGLGTGGDAWDADVNGTVDQLIRPGLLAPDGSGLQLSKLKNLRVAPFTEDEGDGLVNYEETADALGLTDKGLDFHIRSQPNLRSLDAVLQNPNLRENNLRVTYVGNVTEVYEPANEDNNLRICVMFVDAGGNVYNGPDGSVTLDADTFGAPTALGPVTFDLPHAADDGIFTDGDATCWEDSVPDGEYAYGEADTLPGHTGPFYNDQHTGDALDLDDFYLYSGELFDADPDNDHERNTDADGHIVLSRDRELVIVYKKTWEAPYTAEICNLLVDADGKAVTGTDYPGVALHVPGDVDTTHTTPLNLNRAVLESTEPNAQCTRHVVSQGRFDYEQASITSGDGSAFGSPTYHDAWTGLPRKLSDFETWDTSDDSNGIMDISNERPHRTLIVKWQLDEAPRYNPVDKTVDPGKGLDVTNLECKPAPGGKTMWRYEFDVKNGGVKKTQLNAKVTVHGDDYRMTRGDQTRVLNPGEEHRMHVDFENLPGFTCKTDGEVDVDLSDKNQLVRQKKFVGVLKLGLGEPPESERAFHAEAGKAYFLTSEDIVLTYYDDDPEDYARDDSDDEAEAEDDNECNDEGKKCKKYRSGHRQHRLKNYIEPAHNAFSIDITVRDDNLLGLVRYTGEHDVLVKEDDPKIVIPSGNLPPGEYIVTLDYDPIGLTFGNQPSATQRLVVVAPLNQPEPYVPPVEGNATEPDTGSTSFIVGREAKSEVRMLSSMVNGFCPTFHDDATDSPADETWGNRCAFKDGMGGTIAEDHPGDIYRDVKSDLVKLTDRLLHSNGLPRYDITNTLVLGSNVAHSAITDEDVQDAIEAWVNGGGNLIVLGSTDLGTSWLKQLFYSGDYASSGGVKTPDLAHPLMSTPELLSIDDYQIAELGWTYPAGGIDHFTDILLDGDSTVTAISDPGDFGDGSIILSTWRPYDLFGEGSGTAKDEGQKVLFNFLMHGYRDLFLDYGPELPSGIPIVPAVGVTQVNHPELGRVAMTATIYVFPSDR